MFDKKVEEVINLKKINFKGRINKYGKLFHSL